MSDNCEIIKLLPELVGGTPKEYCHNKTGWQPQLKMFASYDVPWQDLRFSTNFQSLPGPALQAGNIYSNADVAAALGRTLTAGNKTVNIFNPNTAFGDRLNEVDLRFSKIFKLNEGNSIDANFDIYNTLNSDARTAEITTFGGTWRRPTAVIQGRIFKFGMRWDF